MPVSVQICAGSPVERISFGASDGAEGYRLGTSVAISGETVVAGAFLAGHSGRSAPVKTLSLSSQPYYWRQTEALQDSARFYRVVPLARTVPGEGALTR
ncbi:MAG: hypothetical protein FJ403_15360 [Verrucomicrobia bacterium]|nr:hypothetical protein [Verrucomicrobiota bacterium]